MNKKTLKIGISIISILLLGLILYLVISSKSSLLDKKGYDLISKYISNRNTIVAKTFTFLGSTLFITILCILSLFFKKYRFIITPNTLIAVGVSQALKRIICRIRPVGIALIEETGYSFPSGHSMVSFAFYGLIIYLIYKSKLNIKLKVSFITLFSIIIINIGLSRIYLGVHYVTDVIGGYLLGFICLILFVELIYKKYILKKTDKC